MMPATATETCRRGHPRTAENVWHGSDGKPRCRVCRNNGLKHAARTRNRHPREVLLEVPNEPLRERFLELQKLGRVTAVSVAAALDWYGTKNVGGQVKRVPDSTRVLKRLGLTPQDGKYATTVRYETAVAIAQALGMEPYEAGV
jgi:hypothetical protein